MQVFESYQHATAQPATILSLARPNVWNIIKKDNTAYEEVKSTEYTIEICCLKSVVTLAEASRLGTQQAYFQNELQKGNISQDMEHKL